MKIIIELFNPKRKLYNSWVLTILRIIVGIGFVVHGYVKLKKGPAGFTMLLDHLGMPAPELMAWLAILAEFLGGIALIIGVYVSLVSIPLIITMITAIATIHFQYGYSSIQTIGLDENGPKFGPPGYEINILYIGALITLLVMGAGKFSIDAIIANSTKRRT